MSSPIHLSIGQMWAGDALADGKPISVGIGRHVDLGPEHPSRTGLLGLDAELDDERLTAVRIQPGYNHRSVEKLFEVRDYRQVLVLADRHDWQAPFTGELVVALACEHLMGLVPPERATWLRTLFAEHARISSHLAQLSFVGHATAAASLQTQVRSAREQGRRLLLAATGNRIHPMVNRLGGFALDVGPDLLDAFCVWADDAVRTADNVAAAVRNCGLGAGVAVVDAAACDGYGLWGPAAIAAGIDDDLRAGGNYLAYGELSAELGMSDPHGAPDARTRLLVLCEQVGQSARLLHSIVGRLAGIAGPVDTKLSKIVKLPDSAGYAEVEAPWGRAGALVVSRAERTPWRLALRTPSFANVQALAVALEGCRLDDVDVALASLGWTSGDLDK